jgi:hypothetical protein
MAKGYAFSCGQPHIGVTTELALRSPTLQARGRFRGVWLAHSEPHDAVLAKYVQYILHEYYAILSLMTNFDKMSDLTSSNLHESELLTFLILERICGVARQPLPDF